MKIAASTTLAFKPFAQRERLFCAPAPPFSRRNDVAQI